MSHEKRHRIVSEDLQRITDAPLPWRDLDDSTVVITGAAGLVASYLAEALLFRNERQSARPTRVVATVRNTAAAKERFAAYLDRQDFEIVEHDAAEPLHYDGRIHYLVHAAGNATPSAFGRDPIGTYAPNVIGTHHLMARAKADETRAVLFLSSGAVHGALPADAPALSETIYGAVDPLDPRASYAESKRMGETICRSWWVQHGVPTRMARLGHSYGPGMRRSDERAFAQFVFSALDRRDIVLNSDGSAIRPYCYLADATVALLLVLLSGGNGEPYLVANTDAMCSIRELAELVADLAPERIAVRGAESAPPAEYVPNRDPFHQLDTSKIVSLGWKPQVRLRDGFRRTLDSYR